MSRTIENRVVQMEFQNKQFEDAVEQSRQSIQLLEKDLKLLEGVEALKNLDEAVQAIDVSGIADGIDALNKRFSTLGIISMTVTQNLTNAFTNLLVGGLKNAGSAVTGLFNNIMTRGMSRAKNIENAKFSLMGLLKDADKVQQVFDIASASVDGTAYALDSAAKAAATLVATFGSDASGLASVDKALKGIVGVAAQTNREFDSVAQIFTTVAGNGRVMGMQLTQLSSYGLNAAAAIAEYLNQANNKKLRNKLGVGKWASEAEVRDLVSKGKITADMFSEAFYGFYENAEKANETIEGVKANIGSALGRIGQAFISPLIEQNSPLVKFLNTVRTLVNGIKSSILDLKIPDYVTETLNMMIGYAQDVVGKIDPGEWSIFKNISVLTSNIRRSLEIVKETDSEGNEILYDAQHKTDTIISTWNSYFNKQVDLLRNKKKMSVKSVEDYFKDIIADRYGEEALKSYERFGDRFLSMYGAQSDKVEEARREARAMRDQAWSEYLRSYDSSLVEQAQMYADEETDKYMDTSYKWIEMWHTNYIQNIMDAISNISETFGFLKDTVNEAIIGLGGPFAEFWQMITGQEDNATSLRLVINGITNLIKEGTEKIKNYIQDNEDIKGIIEGIVAVVSFLGKVVSSVWTILGNAFKSFSPLFERIVRLLGAVGSTLYDINNEEDTALVFATIVEKISGAIDWLAKGIIFLWDVIAEGFRAFDYTEVWENQKNLMSNIKTAFEYVVSNLPIWIAKIKPYIQKFIGAIIKVGVFIAENFPIWFEKARPYLEIFGEKIVEVGGFLTDILGEAFDEISPYVEDLVGWLDDLTGNFKDVEKPIEKVNDILEDNAGALETVNNVAETVSDTISGVTDVFGGFSTAVIGATTGGGLGRVAKAFSFDATQFADGTIIDKIYEKKGKLTEVTDEIEKTPFEKIKGILGGTYEFINTALRNLGILDEGETLGSKLKGFFASIGDWIKNTDWEKVLNTIIGIAYKIAGVFAAFAGVNIANKTAGVIKKIPTMLSNVTGAIQSFSPFWRDVAKVNNLTTQREAMAKILKSIAAVIISIAVAVAVIAYAIYKLGQMDTDQLKQGVMVVGAIMLLLVGLIMFLAAIIAMIAGKGGSTTTSSVAGLPGIKGIKGIKQLLGMLKSGGLGKETKTITNTGDGAWKSIAAIAGVIGAFALAVGLISLSIGYLSTFSDTELERGIGAFVQIAGVIIILMILLGAFAMLLRGGTDSQSFTGKGVIDSKYGVKTTPRGLKQSFTRNNSDWKVIAAMAVAILLISAAIGGLMAAIAVIANIPMKNLDQAMTIFFEITLAMAGLILILGLIASLMTAFNKNNNKSIAGSIIAMAVLFGVIGFTIASLMQIIVEIALLPIDDVTAALDVFWAVSLGISMIIGVIGIIMIMISLMTGFGKNGDKVASSLYAAGFMIAMIGVLFVGIGASFVLIGMAVGEIALALMKLDESKLPALITIISILTGLIVAVLICVAVIIGMTKNRKNLNKSMELFGGIAAVFGGIGIMIAAIALLAYALQDNNIDVKQLKNIMIVMAVIVGVVMGCIIALVALSKGRKEKGLAQVSTLIATIAATFIALGAMFAAIGLMAMMIGESGVDLEGFKAIIITITVLVGLVMGCVVAIVALMMTGAGELVLPVIAVIAALFYALASVFLAIGVAAVGVGWGVTMLVGALQMLILFFSQMDEETLGTAVNNMETFFKSLGSVIFAGLIGIASFLEANREPVAKAIKSVVKFILEAIWAVIVQSFDSCLEGLGEMIDKLDLWLNQHIFEIERIITNIGDILYTVIDTFMDNLMKLILGENYDGGEDGYLGQLTKGIIMWLRTYFLDEGAIGRTLFSDLFKVLGEEAHKGIINFLELIRDSNDIPTKTFEAIDAVICGIGEAIVTKGPDIVNHVKELIRVTWQLIKYALGISDVPPQSTMFGVTGGTEKGNPEGVMDEMADDMMSELSSIDWLDAVGDFLSNLWNAMLDVAEGVENRLPGLGGLLGLGKRIANLIVTGTYQGLENGSPSRAMEQQGIWAVQGLYQGLTNKSANNDLVNASRDLSSRIVKTVETGLEAVGNPTDNFLESVKNEIGHMKMKLLPMLAALTNGVEAKISPYLDLTQIEEGFGSIQDLMSGNSEFDISAMTSGEGLSSLSGDITDSTGATDAAEGFDDANMLDMGLLNDIQPETILNFTQNNYSPESLSRIDIYRDTKNLLSDPSNLRGIAAVGITELVRNHQGGGGMPF